MKLSMWMIANQLMSLDPVLEISENAPCILNSARLAYATNCVYIYQEDEYIVCSGEGDRIKIPDMEINSVFELVQSIFDTFEDWTDNLMRCLRARDYQQFIDEACKLIKGPMVLLDANNKVLGITSRYGKDDIDHEWKYLWEYGFSSLNAIRYMAGKQECYQLGLRGQQPFRWGANSMLSCAGISSCMYFNDVCCGRINLLARDRELNRGDTQLLGYISELLEPNLGQMYFGNVLRNSSNVFLNLLMDKPYEQEKLERQLSYHQWTMDQTYQLALIRLREDAQKELYLQAVSQLVSAHVTGAEVLHSYPYVMVLSNRPFMDREPYDNFFDHLIKNNPVEIGFSLPIAGLTHGTVLYQQAQYALSRGSTVEPERRYYRFVDYAVDYLILSGAPLDVKVFACMPGVLRLWKEKMLRNDAMFETLEQYLDHERSIVRTSQALFLHKNTGAYRIKKLESFLGSNLDDPELRRYCQLSLMVLQLFEKTPSARSHPVLTEGI